MIDDGSTDGSGETLRRLQAQDERIRLVSRGNRGLIATLNEGLALASGDLIARMDADDIAYPSRVRRQVEAFEAEPDLALCGAGFDLLSADDRVQPAAVPEWPAEDLGVLSMFFCAFRHSTVMFNRAALPEGILRYDPSYPHAEDFELFRRITRLAPGRIIPERLLAYRLHPGSVTSTQGRTMRRTHLRVVQESLVELGETVRLGALLDERTPDLAELIREMVDLTWAMQRARHSVPTARLSAYDIGAEGMFFFLLHMAHDEFGAELAAEFLDRTDGWRKLRRRERVPLSALRRTPRLSTAVWRSIRKLDEVGLRLRSRPLPAPLSSGGESAWA